MVRVTILGSTGTIGQNTLEVIAGHPERFTVFALAAHRNIERLLQQCLRYQPRYAVVTQSQAAQQLQQSLRQAKCSTEVLAGEQALLEIAGHAESDYVVAAIVGAA